MCGKSSLGRSLLLAVALVGLVAGPTHASWIDEFDSSSLDPAWNQSFPATADGWFSATGRSTGVTYTVNDSSDSQLKVTAITGVTTAGWNNVWAINRSVGAVGSNDFTATMDFSLTNFGTGGGSTCLELKAVDSNGWLIAGGMMYAGYGTGFHELYRFDLTSSNNSYPCDINNNGTPKYPTSWSTGLSASAATRMTISRVSDAYTISLYQGADYNNLTGVSSFALGTSSRVLDSIQLAFEIGNATNAGGSFVVDRASFTAVPEPCSMTLVLMGSLGLLAYAWRRRK